MNTKKHLPYPQTVGSLLYAACPDVAHAVSVLSRYLAKWTHVHYRAAKHLLRYIKGTSDLCLVMDGEAGSRILQGYAGADWAGDLDTRRSTTGYIFQVYGSTTCWKSRLQPTVALSWSSDATRHAIWLKKLLANLDLDTSTVPIFNEMTAPNNFDETKHFDIRQNFVRDKVEDEIVSSHCCNTAFYGVMDMTVSSDPSRSDLLRHPLHRFRLVFRYPFFSLCTSTCTTDILA